MSGGGGGGAPLLINQPLSLSFPLSLSSLFDELFLIYDHLFNPHYICRDGGTRVTATSSLCFPPPGSTVIQRELEGPKT